MDDDRLEEIAKTLDVKSRWLPPFEDATMIAGAIARGVCYLEHRGHGFAPLLVFEDGGSMELPLVRWAETDRGFRLVSVGDSHGPHQTTHYDVCGTVDSIESAIGEWFSKTKSPASEVDTENQIPGLVELLNDISHMIDRMERRRNEYVSFAREVEARLRAKNRYKSIDPARKWLSQLKNELPNIDGDSYESFVEKIEGVRDIAQYLEYSLTDYKSMALDIVDLLDRVRGSRNWDREND